MPSEVQILSLVLPEWPFSEQCKAEKADRTFPQDPVPLIKDCCHLFPPAKRLCLLTVVNVLWLPCTD